MTFGPHESCNEDSADQVDEAAQQFEDAWESYLAGKQAQPPSIETFLPAKEPLRSVIGTELALIDFSRRQAHGHSIASQAYSARFPWLRADTRFLRECDQSVTDTAIQKAERRWPQLPGYDILQVEGRGGIGVVFRARQHAPPRMVALKMLQHPELLVAEELVRFRLEPGAAALLQHSNIVPIFEIGEHDGLPFFTMPLLDGGSLQQRMHDVRQDLRSAVKLLIEIARAVHYAHRRGILHRDLKPANILFSGEGKPLIADFGLARRLTTEPRLTRTGDILGTPYYMAPEQAAGKKDLTTAVDIYGLGALLYEILTGDPPFGGKTSLEVIRLKQEIEPPVPRSCHRQVPRDLDTLCQKCLQIDPLKRPDSAEAVAQDLENWLAGRPIKVRPVGPLARSLKWVRRRPALAAFTAILSVFLVGGIVRELLHKQDLASANKNLLQSNKELARVIGEKGVLLDAEQEARELAEIHLAFNRVARAHLEWQMNQPTAAIEALQGCPEKYRGWEWNYLWGRLRTPHYSLTDHRGAETCQVAYSSDGRLLASTAGARERRGDEELFTGEVLVRNAATGQVLQRFSCKGYVVSVAFSPNNQFLAGACMDGKARLWHLTTGQLEMKLEDGKHTPRAVAFSPDGRHLAVALGQRVRLWDLHAKTYLKAELEHAALTTAVTYSPDGHLLATMCIGGAHLWDLSTGKRLWTRNVRGPHLGIAFSPDGKWIVGASESTALLWEARTGKYLRSLAGPEGELAGVAFSPDGRYIAAAASDRTVRVWNADTGKAHLLLRGHTGRVRGVCFSPDGMRLASCGNAAVPLGVGEVKVWDLTQPAENALLDGSGEEEEDIEGLTFDASSQHLIVLRRCGTLQTRSLHTGRRTSERLLDFLPVPIIPATPASFTADASRLAYISYDADQVKIWDLSRGCLERSFRGHTKPIFQTAMSRDGQRVASAAGDHELDRVGSPPMPAETKVWDANSGSVLFEHAEARTQVSRLALNRDGSLLAQAVIVSSDQIGEGQPSKTYELRIWSIGESTARSAQVLLGHASYVQALAFSPDDRLLAAGDGLGTVMLWDARTAQLLYAPLRGPHGLGDFVFSPDGRRLAAVNRDREVMIWAVATGTKVLSLRAGPPRTWNRGFNAKIAWSPDGRFLAIKDWMFNVALWDGASAEQKRMSPLDAGTREFSWHLAEAIRACSELNSWARDFHLRFLERLQSPDNAERLALADLHATMGQREQALAELEEIHSETDAVECAWRSAVIHLASGDLSGYRRVCTKMLKQWETCEHPRITRTVARTLALRAVQGRDRLWLEEWLARKQHRFQSRDDPWLLLLVHYRLGHFEEVLRLGRDSVTKAPSWRFELLHTQILALACAGLARHDEQAQWQARRQDLLKGWELASFGQIPDLIPHDFSWAQWQEFLLLHWEGEAVRRVQE